jgi:hypothetical protein
MTKQYISLLLLLAISLLAGWINSAVAAQTTWRGYVVDRQCADSVRDDTDPRVFLQHHTRDCALMPNCKVKGYSLYANGRWFDFDLVSNQRAIRVLQASKRKNGMYAEVSGSLQGKVLTVQSIKEIDEPKAE